MCYHENSFSVPQNFKQKELRYNRGTLPKRTDNMFTQKR